jgi:hypothetical protein
VGYAYIITGGKVVEGALKSVIHVRGLVKVLSYPLLFWVRLSLRLGGLVRGTLIRFVICLSRMVLVVLCATQLITENDADDGEENVISEVHVRKDKFVLR